MLGGMQLMLGLAAMIGGIEFQIDPSQSTATLEVCAIGVCDSDSSAMEGSMTAVFDCPDAPGAISLEDYYLALTDDLNIHLDYGFLGDIFATGTDLAVAHDGGPEPFTAVVAGQFNVPAAGYQTHGMISYEATGTVCSIFETNGYPCEATLILDLLPPGEADLPGSVQVTTTELVLTGTLDIVMPIDPNNPDLGTIHITAALRATAPRPDTGDVRKFKTKCRRNKLKLVLGMSDASHDGQTARATVNGAYETFPINGDKGKLILKDRFGVHTARLLDPPNCEGEKTADCG